MRIGQRARTGVAVVLALVGVVGLVVFAATRPGPDLAALRADPVAQWVPAGATLTSTHESGSGTTLGKPDYARITRVVRTPLPAAALEAAEALARAHGWAVEYRHTDSFTAYRQLPDWRLELSVVHARVDGVSGNLFVYLTAYPA